MAARQAASAGSASISAPSLVESRTSTRELLSNRTVTPAGGCGRPSRPKSPTNSPGARLRSLAPDRSITAAPSRITKH